MSRKDALELVKRKTAMTVQTGPFAGMVMHDVQTWGAGDDIGPQLLGTYEQELHEWLNRFVLKSPSTIINIGCAEGYYAVGLARLLSTARVLGFDTDLRAQEACRNNSILNRVTIACKLVASPPQPTWSKSLTRIGIFCLLLIARATKRSCSRILKV